MNPITAPEAACLYMLFSNNHYDVWQWVIVSVLVVCAGAGHALRVQLVPPSKEACK